MNHPKCLAPQCHHTLSAGCAASVTSGCKSPTYREANWGEFEGPDLSDKENHLAQKWWTQFFWGSPHACTTIIMYIYIYIWISPNHSIKQFLDPLLLLESQATFFSAATPQHAPRAQGLGTDQTFQWMVLPNFCDVQLCFAKLIVY